MLDEIPMPGKLIIEMYLFCRSYPLARPRMKKTKGGVYQPLENQAVMRQLMLEYQDGPPINRPMALEARIFYAKPPYKEVSHVSRYDSDNLLKGIADNLQWAGIIANDDLLVRMDVTKAYSAEDYLIVRLYEANEHETEDVPRGQPEFDYSGN